MDFQARLLCLVIATCVPAAPSLEPTDLPELSEQKVVSRWNLLQTTAAKTLKSSSRKAARYQSSSEADMRCFAVADDVLEQNSSSLVASMFLKVASDGGWIPDFDEDSWLSNPTQPGTEPEPRAFFALKFTNFTIEAKLNRSSGLNIAYPSGEHQSALQLVADKWIWLRLAVIDNLSHVVLSAGDDSHLEKFTLNFRDYVDEPQATTIPRTTVTDDSGESSPRKHTFESLNGRVSAVCHVQERKRDQPWLHMRNVRVSVVSQVNFSNSCEEGINETSLIYKQFSSNEHSLESICKDQYSLLVLNGLALYDDHVKQCNKFQGSLLSGFDLLLYEKEIKTIAFSLRSEVNLVSWLEDTAATSRSLDSWCPVLLKNGSTHIHPCQDSLQFNVCKVKTVRSFYLFGEAHHFNRRYSLFTRPTGSFVLKSSSSIIRLLNGRWILESNLHKMKCTMSTPDLPVMRNMWTCGSSDVLLALSPCGANSFMCDSGKCLPKETRCNGGADCEDKSDEEKCKTILKDPGYEQLVLPPTMGGDPNLHFTYIFEAYSVAPIETKNFYAEFDIQFSLMWKDPRLTIWNPVHHKSVDCKEIWSPTLIAAVGHPDGHWVDIPDKNSQGCAIVHDDNAVNTDSWDDPYMGRYLEGSKALLGYSLAGVFLVPCEFDLRKYPFGDQKCELSIVADLIDADAVRYERFSPDDDIPYEGKKYVREYKISRVWRKELGMNTSVTLVIEMKSLYGYHVLNSYLTSFVILLISYATLLFRVEDFNERVMVSLTSLLVQTALLSQSNSTSVQTSYLKLLDVWYAMLIVFSFTIVIVNTILNAYRHKLQSDVDKMKKSLSAEEILQRVKKMNTLCLAVMVSALCIFLFMYFLAIIDII